MARVFDHLAKSEDDPILRSQREQEAKKLRRLAVWVVSPTAPQASQDHQWVGEEAPASIPRMLIDDPNPYASPPELEKFIHDLEGLPDCEEVRSVRAQANELLDKQRKGGANHPISLAQQTVRTVRMNRNSTTGILIGSALVIAALIAFGRYQGVAPAYGPFIYKIDRFTGSTQICSSLGCKDLPNQPSQSSGVDP